MKPRSIFICYASTDYQFCKQYSRALRKRGLATWYEQPRQQASSSILKEVGLELQARSIFIVLFSQFADNSYRTHLLTDAYMSLLNKDQSRTIIVLRIDNCEVPLSLQAFPRIDAFAKSLVNIVDETIDLLSRNLSMIQLSPSIISRRAILGGATGIGLVALTSGAVWLLNKRNDVLPTTSHPPPLGKTIFTYHSHVANVFSIAWSPDRMKIASASNDGVVRVWNSANGSPFLAYTHADASTGVAWSPDSKYIASSSFDKTVQVWNTISNSHVVTYRRHINWVTSVAWSPNSTHIASTSIFPDTMVQIWDGLMGKLLSTDSSNPAGVICASWSPDGRYIVSGGEGVRIWDTALSRQVSEYNGHTNLVNVVRWSPDGKYIASGSKDKTVQVWIAATGQRLFTYTEHSDIVFGLTWSPDGRYIASGGSDKTVQIWTTSTAKRVFTYRNHKSIVRTIAWSSDGNHIASAGDDMTVQIWQAK